jgi:hypothetical protein
LYEMRQRAQVPVSEFVCVRVCEFVCCQMSWCVLKCPESAKGLGFRV